MTMMMLGKLALAAGLAIATPLHAHEVVGTGPNGGRVTDAGKYHVELVAKDASVDVYLTDADTKPVPAAGFKGTAILVVDGKPARVALTPADGSRLSGKADVAIKPNPKGAVQLTAPDGTSASGKFN